MVFTTNINYAEYRKVVMPVPARNVDIPEPQWVKTVHSYISKYQMHIATGATAIQARPLDLHHIFEYITCLENEITRLNMEK